MSVMQSSEPGGNAAGSCHPRLLSSERKPSQPAPAHQHLWHISLLSAYVTSGCSGANHGLKYCSLEGVLALQLREAELHEE